MRFRSNSKESRLASRYVPEGSEKIEREGGVVYLFVSRNQKPAVIAYRGTAGRAELHYHYNTLEQRQKAVDEFFASIERCKEWRTRQNEERKATRKASKAAMATGVKSDYSLTETAVLIRQTLAGVFPETSFKVHSKSYSGGCSIDVSWTDGPTGAQVNPILKQFQGADFDGMQDLKTYREGSEWKGQRTKFHVDYVFGHRSTSRTLLTIANERVASECSLPLLTLDPKGGAHFVDGNAHVPYRYMSHCGDVIAHDSYQGECHQQLVYQIAWATSLEDATKPADLPEEITPSYIDSVVENLLAGVHN